MQKYRNKTPDEVIKLVTIEIIERAIKLGKKKEEICFYQQNFRR